MQKKPNILLIILDTMRRDRLSAYGHTRETSPELDEFSTQATVFERAVSPAQWTVPAHASMFTGLYASTHQLTEANLTLSGSYPTLAEILSVEGYNTAGFCNNPLVGVLDNGLQRGFNDFYNYAGAAPNRPFETRRNGIQKALTKHWRTFARETAQHFAQNDWLFRISLNPLLTPIWTRYVNYKGNTETSVSDVIDYLKHQRSTYAETPQFTFLNLMGTHLPYRPSTDALQRVAPHLRRDSEAFRFMGRFNADAARWASPVDEPLDDWQSSAIDDFYDAEIAAQDVHVGRLLRYMKQSGALEDTMVIIAADHGEGHGDHNFFGHSFVVYQELVHVPLMVHFPDRFPQGKRVSTNVSTRRIFHTVLEAADVTPPLDAADPNADVEGLSLARATNCKPDTEGGIVYAEAFPPQTFLSVMKNRQPHLIESMHLTRVRRGVYEGDHKLAMVGENVEGLFELTHDPREIRDTSAQQADLVAQMRAKINQFVNDAESRRAEGALTAEVSAEVVDNLRALGYFE